jgi:putative transposase
MTAKQTASRLDDVPRSPRLQVAGGIYHITSRGNRRQVVFADAEDHRRFLWLLDAVARRCGWLGYGYCLLPNHYHLVLETPKADLSAGMHWLNFRYAQAFNHRHALDGHLFQDRFYSAQVEADRHLVELSRYLALNPVHARLCRHPGEWPWSSYPALAGFARPTRFLAVRRVLGLFGGDSATARARFRAFVNDPGDRPQG